MQVVTYQLRAANGRSIRKVTKVIFADGVEVKFIERMSRKDAVQQAMEIRKARD